MAFTNRTPDVTDETGCMLVSTPIGAGIGAAVGAVLPAGQVTIYRAGAVAR